MMNVTKEDLQQAAQGATELSEQSREHPENKRVAEAASEAWDRYLALCDRYRDEAHREVPNE
jgi:hypothetical protein